MWRIVFTLALIFQSFLVFAQTPWTLKKDASGIRIYTRMVPDSKLKEYKAMTQVDVPLQSILDELLDAPKYTEEPISGESYYVTQKGENQHVFYALKKLPWPIKNRDVVTQLTVERISSKKVMLHIESLPDGIPIVENAIRIQQVEGFWLLEEEDGTTTITQQLYLDPEGSLPPVVTNSLLIKGPYKTFSHLQQIGS
ncbi:START domain-containing protein [Aureisphaera galaxeae]|uniref:START domain-containing protein n=1 Tax=Aureisphaera galaxeae TaxID=1538023 RepID=UPI002350B742|nr:START domain-containing protein [Aureisphaera galaxeae]MDC8005237.1 START domain-containing protein [Aureisphaera galaxeae]